jgi:hypothetical protein
LLKGNNGPRAASNGLTESWGLLAAAAPKRAKRAIAENFIVAMRLVCLISELQSQEIVSNLGRHSTVGYCQISSDQANQNSSVDRLLVLESGGVTYFLRMVSTLKVKKLTPSD